MSTRAHCRDRFHLPRFAVALLATLALVVLGLVVTAATAGAAQSVQLVLTADGTEVVGMGTATGLPEPPAPTADGSVAVAAEKGSALATGRRTYEPIVFRKRIDKASPLLARAYRSRESLPRLTIRGSSRTGHATIWTLTNVRVTSYQTSGSGDHHMEQISMVYEEIEWN
jgi:hypothetical protein